MIKTVIVADFSDLEMLSVLSNMRDVGNYASTEFIDQADMIDPTKYTHDTVYIRLCFEEEQNPITQDEWADKIWLKMKSWLTQNQHTVKYESQTDRELVWVSPGDSKLKTITIALHRAVLSKITLDCSTSSGWGFILNVGDASQRQLIRISDGAYCTTRYGLPRQPEQEVAAKEDTDPDIHKLEDHLRVLVAHGNTHQYMRVTLRDLYHRLIKMPYSVLNYMASDINRHIPFVAKKHHAFYCMRLAEHMLANFFTALTSTRVVIRAHHIAADGGFNKD